MNRLRIISAGGILGIAGLILCLVLFVAGFAIHRFVPRGRAAEAVTVAAGPRASRWPAVQAAGETLATMLEFACAAAFIMAVVLPARLVERLRQRA